jgi:Caspase domain
LYRVFAIAILIYAACAKNAFAQFDPKYNVEVPVKRLALVVGNADYVNAEVLPGSAKDADAIADKLRAAGFTVTLAKNISTRADFLNKYFWISWTRSKKGRSLSSIFLATVLLMAAKAIWLRFRFHKGCLVRKSSQLSFQRPLCKRESTYTIPLFW